MTQTKNVEHLLWRRHEAILITLLVAVKFIQYVWVHTATPIVDSELYTQVYSSHIMPFDRYMNVLIPQIGVLIFLYVAYLLFSFQVVPRVTTMFEEKKLRPVPIILLTASCFILAYVVALGVNIASDWAHPHLFSYREFGVLAMFGYNDRPLTNLLFGWDRAIFMLAILGVYSALREVSIYTIERETVRRAYRIQITNHITLGILLWVSVSYGLLAFNAFQSQSIWLMCLVYMPPAAVMLLINIYWLFPKLKSALLMNIKLIATWTMVVLVFTIPFTYIYARHGGDFDTHLISLAAIQFFLVTPASWLVYRQRKDRIALLLETEKALVKSNTDLQFLRAQINPHFLFNTLNTLYGTAWTEMAENTAEGIQRLGDMMRFMLHENNQEYIPMHKEAEYLRNYIALQRLRIQPSDDIVLEDKIVDEASVYMVAPMLIVPFVENAFKHGVSLNARSWVKITVTCYAGKLSVQVINSIHPARSAHEKSGIGLQNVRQRLSLLYPQRHTLDYGATGNEYIVNMTINLE